MKLNNKGFAITTVLYSLLILFLLLFFATIKILSTQRVRLQKISEIAKGYTEMKEVQILNAENNNIIITDSTTYYITEYRGRYNFKINDATDAYAYLPLYTVVKLDSSKIVFYNNDGQINDIKIYGLDSNENINSLKINSVYTSNTKKTIPTT